MLIRRSVLDRIVAGEIDLAFRRWRRPTVKAGGTLRTAVGMLGVDAVEPVTLRSITTTQAARAGYESRAALLRDIDQRSEGSVYRIQLHHIGNDPRLALRADAELSDADESELRQRLSRMDKASARGPWTVDLLRMLATNPRVRAQDLADAIGLDKDRFKNDVRKLKALGLTISHSPGYELSPRGRALLERLDDQK